MLIDEHLITFKGFKIENVLSIFIKNLVSYFKAFKEMTEYIERVVKKELSEGKDDIINEK